ncbi:Superfamily member pfam12708 with pectate lyase domain [Pseudomonas phage GP100]|nr:Superfamily member pfam12708 with pectate lyase domain [Pseudomonas phage GP100]
MSTLRTDTLQTTDSSYTVQIADLANAGNLRGDLLASNGATRVGYGAGTVASKLDSVSAQLLTSYTSVKQYGAIGDGVTDDTAAIQAAVNASRRVYIPDGNYIVTSPIQVQAGGAVIGAGMLKVRVQRKGVWAGPTFRIGLANGTVSASDCSIEGMLLEQLHPGFVLGTSTTMVDRLTAEQSHIDCYGGYNAKFKNLWFQHGVYGLSLYGCVVTQIEDIRSFGAWDNKTPAVCEQKAVIRLGSNLSVAGHAFCTEVRMERVYIGTGAPSAPRVITVGTDISYTDYENVGSKCALLVEAVEGLEIDNSYFGGCAEDCIQFIPSTICTMISIDNTFFDESYTSNIRFFPTSTPVVNITIGPGCRFNGQFHTRNAIRAEANSGSPVVVGMTIQGIFGNVLETMFDMEDAKAVVFIAPIVNNYNAKRSTTNSPIISAGAWFGPNCREIHVQGGLWGGGTNDWSTSNGCKWGPVFASGTVGTCSGVRVILSSTITGGTPVGGISQTYPT